MQKLNDKLEEIKQADRPGFMMHMVAGYPDMESSARIGRKILEAGADFLEIQIPFSDPVADGPVIATANETSLSRGATVRKSFEIIEQIVESSPKPILIMTYFNIVYRYGVQDFCKKASEIGVQGLIVPDYPFDEDTGNQLLKYAKQYNLAFVQVIASTTKKSRIQEIAKTSSGFVYCMARTGITGSKTIISPQTIAYLATVREHCPLPMAVGFGLSGRDQVSALEAYADIMIVGSALIQTYSDKPIEAGLKAIGDFMQKLTGTSTP